MGCQLFQGYHFAKPALPRRFERYILNYNSQCDLNAEDSDDYDNVVPELAESWEITDGGTVMTFTIRDGATFWDGKPVTAQDVKWSLDRAVSLGGFPTVQMKAGRLSSPEQFEALDDRTFRITLPFPSKLALPDLATPIPIIINSAVANATEYLHRTPAGSGAYRVARWDAGQQLVYERNDNWVNGPVPGFKRVILREVPAQSTRRALIERGSVSASHNIPNKDAKELANKPGVKVVSTPIEMLQAVKIRDPEQRYNAYPFELSGGMCQRVVIAIALACRPRLLIADEPTTGLDVTTQKAVVDLIVELTREYDMSTILITHDLGLAAAYCDRLVVMQKGKIIEANGSAELFHNPRQPYTRQLLQATPHRDSSVRDLLSAAVRAEAMPLPENPSTGEPILTVRNLRKQFGKPGTEGSHLAVADLSFEIRERESLGLAGESGCGKSTISTMIMRLLDTSGGQIEFLGEDIAPVPASKFAAHSLRGKLQMVFQDPTDSLNPRWSAAQSIGDPIHRLTPQVGRKDREQRVVELAGLVGLPTNLLDRFPHQLSGGQKARVGIARAIALEPKLLILDEPTAALDVSVQAVVLNLLEDLKHRLGMSYLFISHDLNVVRLLCDRIMVMQNGVVVEQGDAGQLLDAPQTDYTRSLLAAIPHPPETDTSATGATV
jgi:peptide/nickel transport system ATP-binding protein